MTDRSRTHAASTALRVLYICQMFPWVTQSFTTREVAELRAQGIEVDVVSFKAPETQLLDEQALETLPFVRIVPHWRSLRFARGLICGAVRHPLRFAYWLIRAAVARGSMHTSPVEWSRNLLGVLRGGYCANMTRAGWDLVHAEFTNEACTAAMVASDLNRVPFSFRSHSSFNPALLEEKKKRAALIVSISQFDRDTYLHEVPDHRVLVNRIGMDLRRDVCPIVKRPPSILAIGTLSEKKGHDVLVQSIAVLRDRDVDMTCRIIGSGPEEARLRHLIDELQLEEQVTLDPYIRHADALEAYSSARIFCLACRVTSAGDRDGLPVVLIEAAHAGCVCVSTDTSAIPELLVDGESGLIVPPDRPDLLANAMQRVLKSDELATRLSHGAVKRARSRHDIERNVSELAKAFEVAGKPRVSRSLER